MLVALPCGCAVHKVCAGQNGVFAVLLPDIQDRRLLSLFPLQRGMVDQQIELVERRRVMKNAGEGDVLTLIPVGNRELSSSVAASFPEAAVSAHAAHHAAV